MTNYQNSTALSITKIHNLHTPEFLPFVVQNYGESSMNDGCLGFFHKPEILVESLMEKSDHTLLQAMSLFHHFLISLKMMEKGFTLEEELAPSLFLSDFNVLSYAPQRSQDEKDYFLRAMVWEVLQHKLLLTLFKKAQGTSKTHIVMTIDQETLDRLWTFDRYFEASEALNEDGMIIGNLEMTQEKFCCLQDEEEHLFYQIKAFLKRSKPASPKVF